MDSTPHPEESQPNVSSAGPNAGQPVMAQLAPQGPCPPQPPRRRRRWPLVLLVLVLMGSLAVNLVLFGVAGIGALAGVDSESKVREQYHSLNRWGADKVAVISLEGAILESDGFVKQQIDRIRKDEGVKAVVLRVDSPGGTVSGSDYLYHHLREAIAERNIPLVVSMGSIAASGGYYVSMAVGDTPESIYAEPTTFTGSIGVIIPHYDISKLLADWGIEQDSVSSHPLKGMGSPAKPMTEEERKIFQSLVDDGFKRFKQIVQDGRPALKENPDALDKLATGQIFTADQALANGLVDKIGFIEAAIDRAIELAGLNAANVKVVKYKKEPTLADVFFGAQARSQGFDLNILLDMTAPRAYYLCTWLPSLVGKSK